MKSFKISLKNVATIVACFAVSFVLFTGCDKGDDPVPNPEPPKGSGIAEVGKTYVSTTANGEKVYTLKVTQVATRASAVPTDTYVLLYVDKSGEVKTSTGVVTSSVGETLVLTPTGGTPFTVTVTADGITGISGNIAFTNGSSAAGGSLMPFANGEIEISGHITEDRVLGVPGMAINYVYNNAGLLAVNSGKTLTVLSGTTIRFTQTKGGMDVKSEAVVKMIGEDKLRELDAAGNLSATPGTKSGHITLKGGAEKGSWEGVYINSDENNQFQYVDILNSGNRTDFFNQPGVIVLQNGGKLSMTYSKISGSKCYGLTAGFQGSTLAAFDHNTIEGCDQAPVYLRSCGLAAPFDATSDLSNNTVAYISLPDLTTEANAELAINKTTVPYYVRSYPSHGLRSKLTVNAGVTFYMEERAGFTADDGDYSAGRLVISGTAEAPVMFTHLPGATYYWGETPSPSLQFRNDRSHAISHCIFEYSGSGGDGVIMVWDKGTLSLNNVTIRNSKSYGVYVPPAHNDVRITHSNVTFENCAKSNVRWHDGKDYTQIP